MSKKRTVPEKEIQAEILKWLTTTGFLFWRQNSGIIPVFTGRRLRNGKPAYRMVKLGEPGLPDIIVIVPPGGRMVGLEVKSATGKLREAQVVFSTRLLDAGGSYHVVRSLADAQRALQAV